jgi:hypothetical protein
VFNAAIACPYVTWDGDVLMHRRSIELMLKSVKYLLDARLMDRLKSAHFPNSAKRISYFRQVYSRQNIMDINSRPSWKVSVLQNCGRPQHCGDNIILF